MRHGPVYWAAIAALAIGCLEACGTWSDTSAGDPTPTPMPVLMSGAPLHVEFYRATQWLDGGSSLAFAPNSVVQLTIGDNGRLSLQTGCGWVAGDYDERDGTLKL